ncbi:porin [Tepidimonas taiwanensis]|uniref:Outer membrane porin protein 32 n=1 Tax=Tepidimonas taiwanensis TaxID=307486 RepID=A0A554X4P7_9BURK|nr:porin [Tepidimonas taiwanensis]MCX7692425.1 porin [Tepidimonas taiwanensis]MDM7463396.1 porin [Tepidimonas taiwanensis]TSE30810.1 Outer membrane porin protein 32 [Tepidimonas taiwanensis]UBQ05086.1 porin [Tepidimonas taiwanensis]
MKKSLVALAALAAAGIASAQSSVTLYGVADVWLGSTKTETLQGGVLTGVRQTVQGSGGYNGSRFGLRGTEDLGGGLKANFVLEQGFNIDTGAQASAGLQFNRQAFLGLAGGFGEVRFGRQYTAYDTLRAATNNSFDSSFATTGTVWGKGVADYGNRRDNQITYISPDFSGFSGAITYALGENKTATSSATDTTAFHVKYAAGPLLVGAAYQQEEVSNTVDRTYTLLAGSYDFGVAKLTAGYNRAKLDMGGKDNEYQLGVDFPVASNARIAVGYVHAKYKLANGASNGKGNGYTITGYYDLSKRTRLYAGLNNYSVKNAAGVKTEKGNLYAVGVRHSF